MAMSLSAPCIYIYILLLGFSCHHHDTFITFMIMMNESISVQISQCLSTTLHFHCHPIIVGCDLMRLAQSKITASQLCYFRMQAATGEHKMWWRFGAGHFPLILSQSQRSQTLDEKQLASSHRRWVIIYYCASGCSAIPTLLSHPTRPYHLSFIYLKDPIDSWVAYEQSWATLRNELADTYQ